jgi:outer membrane protein assembly factor BamB
MNLGTSVLQHHRNATRDGVYVDPAFTHQAAAAMHRDPTFTAITQGAAYAQPLYVDGGAAGGDRVVIATEENWVYALDAATGAAVWATPLAPPVPLRNLPCGDIDPLGVTGTPVIDAASRTLFLDAMTTPDGGTTKRHLLYALSVDDGSLRAGFPLDVAAALARLGLTFEADVQGQRGALAVVGGTLYVPYGGLTGDCGAYHGWVLAVPLTNPTALTAWRTAAPAGGVWAPGGVASDGTALYVATGNTAGATTWGGGEAVIRLAPGAVFSGQPADYFAPPDWWTLDQSDQDVGSSGVVLFDVPGASPAQLAVALGKNGKAYLLDRGNLGGIGNGVATVPVASSEIITAPAVYTTGTGTYVVFKGPGAACPGAPGDLTAIAIGAAAPPTITTAWCASQQGTGSPMVTTLDGHSGAIVWGVGAEGDERLHGFDGDTGAVLFAGGAAGDDMPAGVSRFATPIAAKGRIFVAATNTVYAFTSQ